MFEIISIDGFRFYSSISVGAILIDREAGNSELLNYIRKSDRAGNESRKTHRRRRSELRGLQV